MGSLTLKIDEDLLKKMRIDEGAKMIQINLMKSHILKDLNIFLTIFP